MELPAAEFIWRFVLHVLHVLHALHALPQGPQRIRHYRLLTNRTVKSGAQQIRVTVAGKRAGQAWGRTKSASSATATTT